MFSQDSNDPIAIDTMISCFDPSAKTFPVYLQRVQRLVRHVCQSPKEPAPEFLRIRDLFTK